MNFSFHAARDIVDCHFEKGLCSFRVLQDTGASWIRHQGHTHTELTGPRSDATTDSGTIFPTHFMIIEQVLWRTLPGLLSWYSPILVMSLQLYLDLREPDLQMAFNDRMTGHKISNPGNGARRGRSKSVYEILNLNLRALKISMLYKNEIFQCMGKIFCVGFQRVSLKFHTKYFDPYIERCRFYSHVKILELLDFRAHKCFWPPPAPPPPTPSPQPPTPTPTPTTITTVITTLTPPLHPRARMSKCSPQLWQENSIYLWCFFVVISKKIT